MAQNAASRFIIATQAPESRKNRQETHEITLRTKTCKPNAGNKNRNTSMFDHKQKSQKET